MRVRPVLTVVFVLESIFLLAGMARAAAPQPAAPPNILFIASVANPTIATPLSVTLHELEQASLRKRS